VIKCTNCGTINPDTVRNCQNCMAPLPASVGSGESGLGLRTNTQDQPVLPAWLESLRAGDHPAAPPKSFSPEDMREEGMVPSWMQPNRPSDVRDSSPYSSMRSAASPAPNTDEEYPPAKNISANSLIDANALPSWMQPEQPQPPQQNIAASSLVQPEFMPDWMKTMQPSSQAQSSAPPPQQMPRTQPPLPAQGFSAQQLIDQQALPGWMQQEGKQNFTPPTQQPYSPQNNNSAGQAGFAASSLLDMNTLPSWMREGEHGSQPQQSTRQSPQQGYEQQPSWQQQQQQPSSPSWQQQQQQPMYPPTQNGSVPAQSQGGTLSMGSLIDVNALPEWLRSTAEAQQQSQQGQQTGGNYTAPNTPPNYNTPRIDNVRVPNRPRGEVGANEGSEVAANVFASMLGVASNAPQYPAQQQQNYPPTYPGGQSASNIVQPNQPSAMPNNAQGYATGQPVQQSYGQQSGYAMQPGQGNYAGMRQQQQQGVTQMPAQEEKPAKKGGIFEAIRSFFFRS